MAEAQGTTQHTHGAGLVQSPAPRSPAAVVTAISVALVMLTPTLYLGVQHHVQTWWSLAVALVGFAGWLTASQQAPGAYWLSAGIPVVWLGAIFVGGAIADQVPYSVWRSFGVPGYRGRVLGEVGALLVCLALLGVAASVITRRTPLQASRPSGTPRRGAMIGPLARDSQRRPHWVAGTFFVLLAAVGVAMAVSGKPVTLFPAAVCGLYSVYLFRGGRIVIWFW